MKFSHWLPRVSGLLALCFSGSFLLAQLPVAEPPRGWKTAQGQPFQATLLGFDGTTAQFKMPNGAKAAAPLDKLSAEDQQYLGAWLKKQPIKVNMPDLVGVDPSAVKTEVVSEDLAAEKFVYRTEHFEYESQGRFNLGLLREVGRNFEATYELLKALPWNVQPKPASGKYFKAKLLKDRPSYLAAGGMPNSAGMYSSRTETFLVPFESIGVKSFGKGYAKDDDFDSSTLVHELTHQMMHFWLDILPQWVVEGTAEYTSNLPLKAGRFRVAAAKTGLKDYTDFLRKRAVGGMPEPYPLEKLFFVTDQEWSATLAEDPTTSRRMYFTSYLLVYYFMHLDGNKDGQRFLRYFREMGEARQQMEKYELAVEEFKKQPGVTVHPDGSYSWRGNLQAPARPEFMKDTESREAFKKKALEILLDGRSTEEVMKQIRSAYAGLGIKL